MVRYVDPASTQQGSLAWAEMLFSEACILLSPDKEVLASLEQKLKEMDEECRGEESRRVDLELSIMEVKDNLKKAEAGPVTLGTTVDTTHLENVSPRVSAGATVSGLLVGLPGHGLGQVGHISLPLTQSLLSSCNHSPKLSHLPLPQTVPQSTPQPRSRTGLSQSWSQAKALSSRKPR